MFYDRKQRDLRGSTKRAVTREAYRSFDNEDKESSSNQIKQRRRRYAFSG